ncbi:MAG: peptidase T, partial [Thermoguttaceae bacterium]|nr:peptidase T [Thermoguttaceae bacterium]
MSFSAETRSSLLERFLQYVQIDTGSCDDSSSAPSTERQLDLSRLLYNQLKELGIKDVFLSEFGVVYATIDANVDKPCPTIGFCAHVDTAPDVPTGPVHPRVIENYDGSDIVLGDSGKTIAFSENSELAHAVGKTIIVTDGSTLLGGDDKTGVAVMMEMAKFLLDNPDFPHGTIRLCFSVDEEIGRGADHIELDRFKCDFAYTLDSEGTNGIDVETFSADMAIVTFHGVNIHPSIGKGKLVNAIKGASAFIDLLPKDGVSPETTENREPFVHPVDISGNCEKTVVRLILRAFDTPQLAVFAGWLKELAAKAIEPFPGMKADVETVFQYRNMGDGLRVRPEAVDRACNALSRLGRT